MRWLNLQFFLKDMKMRMCLIAGVIILLIVISREFLFLFPQPVLY